MSELLKFLCFFIPAFLICVALDPTGVRHLTEEEKIDRLKLLK